jgi:steroid delta-isomerase-like uncharacterized protein
MRNGNPGQCRRRQPSNRGTQTSGGNNMPAEANRRLITGYADEIWHNGRLDQMETYIAAHYVRHDPGLPMPIQGPEGVRQLVAAYRAAFPDLHFEPELMLADGDKAAVRWRITGTHQGELMGLPATGKRIAVSAIDVYRFENGKIAEQWVALDNLGILQQLGAIPAAA